MSMTRLIVRFFKWQRGQSRAEHVIFALTSVPLGFVVGGIMAHYDYAALPTTAAAIGAIASLPILVYAVRRWVTGAPTAGP